MTLKTYNEMIADIEANVAAGNYRGREHLIGWHKTLAKWCEETDRLNAEMRQYLIDRGIDPAA